MVTDRALRLHELACLVAAVEVGDLGRAAARLGIAEDAIRQAIETLERHAGARLLSTASAVVTATDAGRWLAEAADGVVGALDCPIPRGGAAASGVLRLGCVPELRLQQLQSVLGALFLQLPEISTEVVHRRSPRQLRWLRTGALDLGVVYAGEQPELEIERLYRGEALAAILPLGHPLAVRETLHPGDFEGATLLRFPRWADPVLHDELALRVARAGYRFAGWRELGGADARDLTLAVAEGDGIALAPPSILQAAGEYGTPATSHRLEPAPTMPDTVLAWPRVPPADLPQAHAIARDLARALREP